MRSVEKQSHMEENGKSPETVAKVVMKLIGRHNPPIRVAVGFEYKLACFLIKILPAKLVDNILYKIYMPEK